MDLITEDLVSVNEARSGIAALPRELGERDVVRLYQALRAWTWKALDQRRRDDELREWADLIRRARLRVPADGAIRHKLETLAELIAESVSVSVRLPVAEVLARSHTREVLLGIHGRKGHRATKKQIMRSLDLEQSNLWRIMNHLIAAGLVESVMDGRERVYALSRRGLEEAERILRTADSDTRFEELAALSETRAAVEEMADAVAVDLQLAIESSLDKLAGLAAGLEHSSESEFASVLRGGPSGSRGYVPLIRVVAANDEDLFPKAGRTARVEHEERESVLG